MTRLHTAVARSLASAAAILMVAAVAVACTSGSGTAKPSSSPSSSADLGTFPIATAPADRASDSATAGPNHPALLDMGVPLHVKLSGFTADIVASGPTQSTEYTGGPKAPTRTGGVFSIDVTVSSGSLTMKAADFTSRDETGTPVHLQSVGATSVRVTPGKKQSLMLRGTYGSGAAQLTWRNAGRVVAIWDFNIELD